MGFVSAGYILWTSTPEATPTPVLCHGRKLHRYSDTVWCWCWPKGFRYGVSRSRRDCEKDTIPETLRPSDRRLCDQQNICHTRLMLQRVLSFLKDLNSKDPTHQKIKTKKRSETKKTSKDQNKTPKDWVFLFETKKRKAASQT